MRMPPIFDKGRRRGLVLIAALALLQGAAAGGAAFATRILFGGLHQGAPISLLALAMIAGAGIVIAGARISFAVIGDRLGQAYAFDIRKALFTHATGLAASDVEARRAGYISLRFVGDMTAFKSWLGLGLPHMIAGLIQLPILILVIGLLDPGFGLIGLAVFAAALLLILWLGRNIAGMHKSLRSRRAAIAADMSDLMPAAHDLGQLGRAGIDVRHLRKLTRRMIDASVIKARRAETLVAIADVATAIMASLILWRAYADQLETGVVAGALAALGLGGVALRSVAKALDRRGAFLAAEEKCAAALARPRTRMRSGERTLGKGPLSLTIGKIALERYPTLSFSVDAGGRLNLTGAAAENAERLFSTLQGREKRPEGEILIGGVALEEISPSSLRRRVGRVTTNPLILRGSLRRTLTLGLRKRPSDERVLGMMASVGLSNDLFDLDLVLLAGGTELKPAERARIALANALLNNPGVLLIDAATSSHLNDLEDVLTACGHGATTLVTVNRKSR
jgi:ABC-type multidrug transport system fused ATPase/permease subunit